MKKENNMFIYRGILFNNRDLLDNELLFDISYSFENNELSRLHTEYRLDKLTKDLPTIQSATIIMNYFHSRLGVHFFEDFDNDFNTIAILKNSFEREKSFVTVNQMTKIFHDCLLSCKIISRRVKLYPYSPYDGQNFIVVEVYDEDTNKWVMFDIVNNCNVLDADRKLLSLSEIRDKVINDETCFTGMFDLEIKNIEKLSKKSAWYIENMARQLFLFELSANNAFLQNDFSKFIVPLNFDLVKYQEERYKMILEHVKMNKNKDTSMYISRIKKEREMYRNSANSIVSFKTMTAIPIRDKNHE